MTRNPEAGIFIIGMIGILSAGFTIGWALAMVLT